MFTAILLWCEFYFCHEKIARCSLLVHGHAQSEIICIIMVNPLSGNFVNRLVSHLASFPGLPTIQFLTTCNGWWEGLGMWLMLPPLSSEELWLIFVSFFCPSEDSSWCGRWKRTWWHNRLSQGKYVRLYYCWLNLVLLICVWASFLDTWAVILHFYWRLKWSSNKIVHSKSHFCSKIFFSFVIICFPVKCGPTNYYWKLHRYTTLSQV